MPTKGLPRRRICQVSCTSQGVSVQIERPVEFERVQGKRGRLRRYGTVSVLLVGLLVLMAKPCGDGYNAGEAGMTVRFLNKATSTPYAQQYYNAEFAQVFREQR